MNKRGNPKASVTGGTVVQFTKRLPISISMSVVVSLINVAEQKITFQSA